MWASLVGQERAAQRLERAAARPSHAYLIIGSRGAGSVVAARALAAALLDAALPESVVGRVQRGRHPDVVEFEPEGLTYKIGEEVREGIIAEANRSPIESDRKVVLVLDAERLRNDAQNALLKTIEEPPARTVMVLVAEAPDDLLPTVRSRCQRIDLDTIPEETVRVELERNGADPERAAVAARLAGGRLDRAQSLVDGSAARVRDAFVVATTRANGTGGMAVQLTNDLVGALDEGVAEVEATQAREVAELDEEVERAQYPTRTAQAMRTRLGQRQKREQRRARTDLLVEGLAAMESRYRDALVGVPALALNQDRELLMLDPAAAARGIEACAGARRALYRNPNERLLLDRLLIGVPAGRR
ncbi:MAG: ATP-binding protein [Acidimicrobiia bacterium]